MHAWQGNKVGFAATILNIILCILYTYGIIQLLNYIQSLIITILDNSATEAQ